MHVSAGRLAHRPHLLQLIASVIANGAVLQEGAADEDLSDVRYKLLNLGLVTAGVGHCLVLQVRTAAA